jgi:hypothetical protein
MNYLFLAFLLIVTSLSADRMKERTLGCPSVMLLQKAPHGTEDDYISLNMYAIANDCVILSPRDSVEAVGYDPLNSKEIFQKVVYKKTDTILYIPRSTIQVEQAGKKGNFRF